MESPLRPKEIQARIRAGETAEEIAATAGIPVERVRWFEGPVLQEREYMAQQAQRVAVRLPGETTPGPTLGELVAERLTRRGVPAEEIDWDSCKRDDNLWRVRLGFVWNGHTRHAEWLFDPRRRHITPNDEEAMRLSAADYVDPPEMEEEATVRPFLPRLTPVPPLADPPPATARFGPPATGPSPCAPSPCALSRPRAWTRCVPSPYGTSRPRRGATTPYRRGPLRGTSRPSGMSRTVISLRRLWTIWPPRPSACRTRPLVWMSPRVTGTPTRAGAPGQTGPTPRQPPPMRPYAT